ARRRLCRISSLDVRSGVFVSSLSGARGSPPPASRRDELSPPRCETTYGSDSDLRRRRADVRFGLPEFATALAGRVCRRACFSQVVAMDFRAIAAGTHRTPSPGAALAVVDE